MMTAGDVVRFAARALLGHRLRSALSLLGVAIGVAAVVVLTALGEGARRYVTGQFAGLGTNLLIVLPGRTETTGAVPGVGGVPNDLTLDDARALVRSVPGVEKVAPVSMGTETVSHRERQRQVAVLGSTAELLEVRRLKLARGEFLPPGEFDRGDAVVVLASKAARELFPGEDPLGAVVRVGDFRLRVIGILAPRGVQLGVDMDDAVILPVASAMRLLNRRSLFRILVQVRAHAAVDPARQAVVDLLKERHGEEDVTCFTQEAMLATFSKVLTALTLAVAAIAAISLSVAGLGIMNVMLVTVSERTQEIGLLKAIGAGRRQVLLVFLTEALLLAAAGALLGVLVGDVAALTLSRLYPDLDARPPAWAVAAALGVAVVVGGVFGVLPARRATSLDPVAALARR